MPVSSRAASLIAALLLWGTAVAAQPTLSASFLPATMGPGSTSILRFDIANGSASPVTGMGFSAVLPAGVTIAGTADALTDCPGGATTFATLTTMPNTQFDMSDGELAGSSSCFVQVNVTASTPGIHTLPAVTLNGSAGSSMSLPVDLTVSASRPGFSKLFSPDSIPLGSTSTLTYTIDNSANASNIGDLSFSETFPAGIVIASPSNASTDCGNSNTVETVTANPGESSLSFESDGNTILPGSESLAAGATCSVVVNVVGTGAGEHVATSNNLLSDFTAVGAATDTLEVTVTPLAIAKSFTDDPAPAGGTATLEFTLNNFNRNDAASAVAFDDDLDAMLSGSTFGSLLANDCGGSVAGVGSGLLSLTGGSIAAGASCTIRVSVPIPSGADTGTYPNTTTAATWPRPAAPATVAPSPSHWPFRPISPPAPTA